MATDSIKQWEVQSSTGKHFDVLDGIRGVAILMVVAYHTFYTNPGSGALMRTVGGIFGSGWMGVPIFFVLSGFLISYPFFRQRAADEKFWYQPGYARRRIGKIIPPFYLSIVIFTIYYFLRFSDSVYFHAAWQWALGLPNFTPAAAHLNSSYWSLIVEAHFYILLPILFFLTRGLKPRVTPFLLFLILFVVPLAVRQLTWPDVPTKESVQFLASRFPGQMDFFAWGVLFSGMFVSLSSLRSEFRALSLLGYIGVLLLIVTIGLWVVGVSKFDIVDHPKRWSTESVHLLTAGATFLMLFFVFDPNCLGSRIFGFSPLRFIGVVSYEWFLFHQPVVTLFRETFGQSRGNLFLYLGHTVLPLALTFGFSVIVYRFFSLPLLNRIRGKTPRNAAQPIPSNLNTPDASAKLPNPTLKQ